jgi:hypothetical protein
MGGDSLGTVAVQLTLDVEHAGHFIEMVIEMVINTVIVPVLMLVQTIVWTVGRFVHAFPPAARAALPSSALRNS